MSEVVRSMNISAGSSIRTGTVNISGSSSTIDEIKFAESDLNAVVAVKVVNQCRTVRDNVSFCAPSDEEMTTSRFHEVYGDCFISGFIEGGDLHGIISIKTLDYSRRGEVKTAVKGQLNSSMKNWSPAPRSSSSSIDKVMESAEAASVFPQSVAKCPQRTWAILSRYDTIPNFIEYAQKHAIAIRRYDGVQTFTCDLLDMHMEYKTNVQMLTHAMGHLDQYYPSQEKNAIAINVASLVTERHKLKIEMAKLVKVIEELNKDPHKVVNYNENLQIESPEVWRTRLPIRKKPEEAATVDTAIRHVLDHLPVMKDSSKTGAPEDPLEFALGKTVQLVNHKGFGYALDMGTCQQLKLNREGTGKDAVWTIEQEGQFLGLQSAEKDSAVICSPRAPARDKRSLQEWKVEYRSNMHKFSGISAMELEALLSTMNTAQALKDRYRQHALNGVNPGTYFDSGVGNTWFDVIVLW
ncbi:hypothetical protein TrVGV298_008163 [Trichoderma virens]|nr:hypothetical protein TrVGV298_008163 [Trichoderma virens]